MNDPEWMTSQEDVEARRERLTRALEDGGITINKARAEMHPMTAEASALKRGTVRVSATSKHPITANAVGAQVWDGMEWIALRAVTRIELTIAAEGVVNAMIELLPGNVLVDAGPGQIVLRDAVLGAQP